MKTKLRENIKKILKGPLSPIMWVLWALLSQVEWWFFELYWLLSSAPKPTAEQQRLMRENVTFIFKSFERQSMAKRLYKNIQKYYPGVRVIIVDDSRKALKLGGPGLEIIQLPFNSGLSRGLNCALEKVYTPYTIRMDDDELLTPYTNFHGQLEFLMSHPEIDLVGVLCRNIPIRGDWKETKNDYFRFSMSNAPKPLIIPHMTQIDQNRIVSGKTPNVFLARTDQYRAVGYDDSIRMLDHHEFFFRAAGNLVSVLDFTCYVVHYHNIFDRKYETYRYDVKRDMVYIRGKMAASRYFANQKQV